MFSTLKTKILNNYTGKIMFMKKKIYFSIILLMLLSFATESMAIHYEDENGLLKCTPDTSYSISGNHYQKCIFKNKKNTTINIDVAFLFENLLENGNLKYKQPQTADYNRSIIVTNVTSYSNTTAECDFGGGQTRKNVTQLKNTTVSHIYCYDSINQINNETYEISWLLQKNYFSWLDISNKFYHKSIFGLSKPEAYIYENITFVANETKEFEMNYRTNGNSKWDFWVGEINDYYNAQTYFLLDPWSANDYYFINGSEYREEFWNMEVYTKLDETPPIDDRGWGFTLTNNGALITQSGKINNAFSFNSTDYIDIDYSNTDLSNAKQISYGFWLKLGNLALDQWVASGGPNADGLRADVSSSNGITVYGGGVPRIITPFPGGWDSNWHHFVVTHDGIKIKVYLDGSYLTQVGYTGDISSWSLFRMGMSGTNGLHDDGKIDEFFIKDGVLGATAIGNMYNLTKSRYIDNDLLNQENLTINNSANGFTVIYSSLVSQVNVTNVSTSLLNNTCYSTENITELDWQIETELDYSIDMSNLVTFNFTDCIIPNLNITTGTINFTSDGGKICGWNGTTYIDCGNTTDRTPTFRADSAESIDCKLSNTSANWTTLNESGVPDCSTTGSTSHICTYYENLPYGQQELYFSCKSGAYESDPIPVSNKLNITILHEDVDYNSINNITVNMSDNAKYVFSYIGAKNITYNVDTNIITIRCPTDNVTYTIPANQTWSNKNCSTGTHFPINNTVLDTIIEGNYSLYLNISRTSSLSTYKIISTNMSFKINDSVNTINITFPDDTIIKDYSYNLGHKSLNLTQTSFLLPYQYFNIFNTTTVNSLYNNQNNTNISTNGNTMYIYRYEQNSPRIKETNITDNPDLTYIYNNVAKSFRVSASGTKRIKLQGLTNILGTIGQYKAYYNNFKLYSESNADEFLIETIYSPWDFVKYDRPPQASSTGSATRVATTTTSTTTTTTLENQTIQESIFGYFNKTKELYASVTEDDKGLITKSNVSKWEIGTVLISIIIILIVFITLMAIKKDKESLFITGAKVVIYSITMILSIISIIIIVKFIMQYWENIYNFFKNFINQRI